jgi:hypothetical protein
MRNRWYTPEIGRFITKDPLMEVTIPISNLIKVPISLSLTFYVFGFNYTISSPNYLHRYTYAEANPINLIDPYGLQAFSLYIPSFPWIFEDGGDGISEGGEGISECIHALSKAWNLYQQVKAGLNDKYGHCVAFCEINRGCGRFIAEVGGYVKEGLDFFERIFLKKGEGWSQEDIEANKYGINAPPGISCENHCSDRYDPCKVK